MDKFKKYAEILKNFSKDMEMWKACEEDEIADAKEKYTSSHIPVRSAIGRVNSQEDA